MLDNLIVSSPGRRRHGRALVHLLGSVAVHAALVALGFALAARFVSERPDPLRGVTYFELPPPVEDVMAAPAPSESERAEPQAPSEYLPEPLDELELEPEVPAGFQELVAPTVTAPIGELADGPAVRRIDFRGRGLAGGFGDGGGRGGAADPGGVTAGLEDIFLAAQVSVLPVLVNPDEVAQLMLTSRPRELSSLGGRVVAEFVVDIEGRVDTTTIRIREGGPPGLAGAASRVARSMRFRPARVDGRTVAVWVAFPLEWNAE